MLGHAGAAVREQRAQFCTRDYCNFRFKDHIPNTMMTPLWKRDLPCFTDVMPAFWTWPTDKSFRGWLYSVDTFSIQNRDRLDQGIGRKESGHRCSSCLSISEFTLPLERCGVLYRSTLDQSEVNTMFLKRNLCIRLRISSRWINGHSIRSRKSGPINFGSNRLFWEAVNSDCNIFLN